MRRFCEIKSFVLLAILFGPLSYPGESKADPAKYPQFAQQQLPKGVAPSFIYLDQLVDEIVKGKKPLIVDVRSREEYNESWPIKELSFS